MNQNKVWEAKKKETLQFTFGFNIDPGRSYGDQVWIELGVEDMMSAGDAKMFLF